MDGLNTSFISLLFLARPIFRGDFHVRLGDSRSMRFPGCDGSIFSQIENRDRKHFLLGPFKKGSKLVSGNPLREIYRLVKYMVIRAES